MKCQILFSGKNIINLLFAEIFTQNAVVKEIELLCYQYYFLVLDDTSSDCHYVDLLLNPERYTGYKGESAHRIWNSIYQENCFK